MMAVGPEAAELWHAKELGEILRHQLAAPLEFEIIGVGPELVARLRAEEAADPEIQTFGDLFEHAHPPVEMLEVAKEFAKASRAHADGPLPDEVAVVLHLLSIVVALKKCAKRITRLDEEGLRFGVRWALAQPWLDESTRKLLQSGLDQIAPENNASA
jgi:hypothetical protein